MNKYLITVLVPLLFAAGNAQAFTHNGNVYIDGSLCVGFDCVTGAGFGFDTIRLNENNLRIKFDDTSVAASFPRNDWELTANDSANGGAERFSIRDATASRDPFTISAGAPSNSLYVRSNGNVGLNTAIPVVELHIKDGDTPTLRLEQDGTSGFTPQTWDLAGNETNFFIRDVTNGSKLPFRIRPGAPTSTIDIASNGNVGIGTSSPNAELHVSRNGAATISLENSNLGTEWFINSKTNGNFAVSLQSSGGTEMDMDGSGNVEFRGTVMENSSYTKKHDIRPVNTETVLNQVIALPISRWIYNHDRNKSQHMGPMAEDFYAAFGLGANDKVIATLDTSGVALASIQALHEKQQKMMAQKNREIELLKSELENLKQTVQKLMARDQVAILSEPAQ